MAEQPLPLPTVPEGIRGRLQFDLQSSLRSGEAAILLYDHSLHAAFFATASETGDFVFPLEAFVEGRIYSLHVLSEEMQYFGYLDFDPDSPSAPSLRYEGGEGFDLGLLEIQSDLFGRVRNEAIPARVGGGFSLYAARTSRLDAWLAPPELKSAQVYQDLGIADDDALIAAFYSSSPSGGAQTIGEWSSFAFAFESKIGQTLSAAVFEAGGPWLDSFRYSALALHPGFSGAVALSRLGYALLPDGPRKLALRIYPGQFSYRRYLALLHLSLANGSSYILPRLIASGFSSPQKIESYEVDGGGEQEIDYDDPGTINGLTEPFCFPTSELNLRFSPPRELFGEPIGENASLKAKVSLLHYEIDAKEGLKAQEPSYSGSYADALDFSGNNGETYRWDPEQKSLEAEFGEASQQGFYFLTLPAEILKPVSSLNQTNAEFSVEDDEGRRSTIWIKIVAC